VTDPNKSYEAGRLGQPMPPGGDANSWQVGWAAGQQLRDYNTSGGALPGWGAPASQPNPLIPKGYTGPVYGRAIGSLSDVLHYNPKLVVVLLVVLALPLYRYTIPLWAALYPIAAVVSIAATWAVYHAVGAAAGTTPSDRLLVGGGTLLVVAFLTTRFELRLARQTPGYRAAQHFIRLALTFLWGMFALTLYEHITPVRGIALQIPPRLDWSTQNIALSLAAVVVMHLWLSGKRPWKPTVNRSTQPFIRT
jgi:hypothetical protein